MKGVFDVYDLQVGENKKVGEAQLRAYERKKKVYISLHVGHTLMMDDTQIERNTNQTFCNRAKGRVLIAGLGIGLILENIRKKVESEKVTEIIVIEKYQDVIDLVSPYFGDFPIKYICADILEYIPSKNEKFDTIYFDIWPDVSTANLDEIRMLHNRWRSRKRDKTSWMDSWMREHLQDKRKQERDSYIHYYSTVYGK